MPTTTTKQYIIKQLQNAQGDLLIMHPETDAAVVLVKQGTGHYEGQATDVQAALEELFDIAQSGGVTINILNMMNHLKILVNMV